MAILAAPAILSGLVSLSAYKGYKLQLMPPRKQRFDCLSGENFNPTTTCDEQVAAIMPYQVAGQ
ncbi:hypothetical protein HNR39_003423 [Glaciimonas immobilis]|uniref:Uncharacterized protein n=1 Tax=Glaciimonas immobilis TaxID=728004 RepID=A0A840RYS0_9BURK|nr:hypothetical protein [Glaciimonas immobilis]